MLTVHIEELKNYTPQLICSYLSQSPEKAYNIIIPREKINDDHNYNVFWNYHLAAYTGQLLYNVSVSFAHYVPCPGRNSPFRFEVQVTSLDSLAQTLFLIVNAFTDDVEATLNFLTAASGYLEKVFAGQLTAACESLINIATDHYQE